MERRHYRQRLDLMMYEKQRQEILKDLGADPYVD
jgi:preprotein translocase subunit SecA